MSTASPQWQLTGDYFENCSCAVVCPCLFSPNAPFTSQPSSADGACEVAFGFHVDKGSYGNVTLDGLSVGMIARSPGRMADGNWSAAVYLDDHADAQQQQALTAIFTGGAGGPVATLAPLISQVLGVKTAPITFSKNGTSRSLQIPGMARLGVHAAPSLVPDQAVWASNAHPFNLGGVAMAVGDSGSTWDDYGMHWDNSGKNGHYAPINWSGA
ncbi:MAG TPA: DUF1326 domain-containing protein [Ktedonobacterales bacterium]|nr:DUF1326 domain-containing protein [Ktedonobacterales bacterium]